MNKKYKVAVLPGDGIGPEIINEAVKVLSAIKKGMNISLQFEYADVGGVAYDNYGTSLPEQTLNTCKDSDAILFGAIGGPQYDNISIELRPEKALLKLRKELGLYINSRPALTFPSLINRSPIRREILKDGVDILIVRELSSGLYYGEPKKRISSEEAVDTMRYTKTEISRILTYAFEQAQQRDKKLTVVDKENVLQTSKLWREVVSSFESSYSDVEVDYMYIDNCTMQLVMNPHQFDVIVTENTFGDIISDEASALTGSIGMLPSASLGGQIGLYEPIHGSAPDIAGMNIANPIATILSASMMLENSFQLAREAEIIRKAINNVLEAGIRTPDISQENSQVVSTSEMGDAIVQEINRLLITNKVVE
ncbi:3-isopropylmalate dehydrogenase [Salirhabdus salicampi]|uniref:3-isopropylmalate dehydrogenase n=1 Tax=Salirhabdus salicampi TaxID=476102 RepID=UPI0020C4ECFF|nr:3-isopropylmalate dehydrogenase [Salirhabdus salicampi]MCP8615254.1 3-isopropylmalate dehydrogenase [Salirhabdus salicampi]